MITNNHNVSAKAALLTIAAVLLLTGRLPAGDDDAKAEKAIKALGGDVIRDNKGEGKPIVSVILNDKKITDGGLKELARLKSLHSLDLDRTDVTDVGLKQLASLGNLQVLGLAETK